MKINGGDDWNDRPYECNAEPPYDSWYDAEKNRHEIKHKCLFFEVYDWIDQRPCDMGKFSVEEINKQAVAWIHTNKFNILAGTTIEDFIDIIEGNGGKVYLLKEESKWEVN